MLPRNVSAACVGRSANSMARHPSAVFAELTMNAWRAAVDRTGRGLSVNVATGFAITDLAGARQPYSMALQAPVVSGASRRSSTAPPGDILTTVPLRRFANLFPASDDPSPALSV